MRSTKIHFKNLIVKFQKNNTGYGRKSLCECLELENEQIKNNCGFFQICWKILLEKIPNILVPIETASFFFSHCQMKKEKDTVESGYNFRKIEEFGTFKKNNHLQ